jgi:diguanylate cyclase (GGDEF)-like protein
MSEDMNISTMLSEQISRLLTKHVDRNAWIRAEEGQLDSDLWQEIENQGLTLALVDADHFKNINDTWGHGFGDSCLQFIAEMLTRHVKRPWDVAIRFGGEEFILTSIQRDKESLERHAESLRVAVQTLNIAHEESPFGLITISIGLSCAVPNEDGRYESLLHMADLALYEAKAAGRNRVESSWNLVRR